MKTPITYYGGKQKLISSILPYIPPHKIYVEPFLGGGAIFFAKKKSKKEIINDLNAEMINFFMVAQNHTEELANEITSIPYSRRFYMFNNFAYNHSEFFSPVKRAAILWNCTNSSFLAKIGAGWAFENEGKPTAENSFLVAQKRWQDPFFFQEINERLKDTIIHNQDAIKTIIAYDSPSTFHYIDPPYINTHQGHYKGYTETDFRNLLDTLANIQGTFMLSGFPSSQLLHHAQRFNWPVWNINQQKSSSESKTERKIETITINYTPEEFFPGSIPGQELHTSKLF